jgi:hypothetical protein
MFIALINIHCSHHHHHCTQHLTLSSWIWSFKMAGGQILNWDLNGGGVVGEMYTFLRYVNAAVF